MGEFAEHTLIQRAGFAAGATSVCAVVVTYHADAGALAHIASLVDQVSLVIVIDNTPGEGQLGSLKASGGSILLVENKENLGVAGALNSALAIARENGFHWMLTLDQDTRCEPNIVSRLVELSVCCGEKYAVVGANYFDPRSKRPKGMEPGEGVWKEQKTVITSGALVDVAKAHSVGGFRDDYFIDQVDHEFCLRLRAHGYRVAISRDRLMTHSVGESGGVNIPFLGVLPNHPPSRKYYIARNTMVTIAQYWSREPEWCMRRLVRLLIGLGGMAILEADRCNKVKAFVVGVVDAFKGRMGPCQRNFSGCP